MQRVRFGRTELQVSPAGLGCGSSRLGLATGGDERSAERLVRQALAKGVNFLDTARVYGTEEVVGRAIAVDGARLLSAANRFSRTKMEPIYPW